MSKKKKFEDIYNSSESETGGFSVLAEIQADPIGKVKPVNFEEELPVLPLRNMVLFPQVVVPILVSRDSSLKLVKEAYEKGRPIVIATQMVPDMENPDISASGF